MTVVSVIIPSYNTAKFLGEAIESVRRQTFQDVEIIVVDDGSTDDTKSIAEAYPSIVYLYQQNSGVAQARNHGLQQASGDFIQFLDADDILLPTKLDRCLAEFQAHSEADIVYTEYETRTVDLSQPDPVHHAPILDHTVTLTEMVNSVSAYFTPHCPLTRREVFAEVGGFADHISGAEDWHMWIKIAARGKVFRRIDEVLVWYRWTPNSLSKKAKSFAISRLRAYEMLRDIVPANIIDLDEKIADRYHSAAMRFWEARDLPEARGFLRQAIKLHSKGRKARRVLLSLSYLVPDYRVAMRLFHMLVRPGQTLKNAIDSN